VPSIPRCTTVPRRNSLKILFSKLSCSRARQAAREDISVAKAMFARTSQVASLIASLTLPQVRAIAIGNAQQLRVRRNSDSEFWGELLVACRVGEERAMTAVRRQGKLLFCSELIQIRK